MSSCLPRDAELKANLLLEHISHAGVDIEPPRDGDLASFLQKTARALSLVPAVTTAQNFRVQTEPDVAGVTIVYDGSSDTAVFFPLDEWARAPYYELADAIADRAPRAPGGYSTPTKRERTLDEQKKWAASMTLGPERPRRQLTYP